MTLAQPGFCVWPGSEGDQAHRPVMMLAALQLSPAFWKPAVAGEQIGLGLTRLIVCRGLGRAALRVHETRPGRLHASHVWLCVAFLQSHASWLIAEAGQATGQGLARPDRRREPGKGVTHVSQADPEVAQIVLPLV